MIRKYLLTPLLGKTFADNYLDQNSLYAIHAVILSFVSLLLLSLTLLFNAIEKNFPLCVALCITASVVVLCLCIVRMKSGGLTALILLCSALMCLGGYLLFFHSDDTYAKLFWFLLFPPMLMFCVGLWSGSLLFLVYFIFLIAAFLGPLEPFLAYSYPLPVRIRFLAAMFGAWIFSWLSEYAHQRTRHALGLAMTRLERESLTDPLTGLGNRRDFQNFFAWLQAKTLRDKKTFCLALIDLDHFKRINDRYGHEVGDAVLRHVVQVLSSRMRGEDRLFRWGGEEFIAIMPDISPPEAQKTAERLRLSVEQTPYTHRDIQIPYTISMGLHCGEIGQEMNAQIALADSLMFMAKRSGRNQVCCRESLEQAKETASRNAQPASE